MSDKNVRLYVVGDGDAELQALIEKGLSELGRTCGKTAVEANCCSLFDTFSDNEIPVVIKPYIAS